MTIRSFRIDLRFLWVLVLLAVFLALSLLSVREIGITYDEDLHFRYGMQILNLNSDRFDDSKMPFSALNAIPTRIIDALNPANQFTLEEQIALGRVVTILISGAFALVVFSWGRELYGYAAGLLALFLFTFEANIIAHSQLVTTDIYAMGMIALSTYLLWRYCRAPDWKNALVFATVLSLAQLAKYTSIFLYPLLAITLVIHDLPHVYRKVVAKDTPGLRSYLVRLLLLALLVVMLSILVINVGFLFNDTFTTFGEYSFRSTLFQALQRRLDFLNDVPIPLPYPYLEGLDWIIHNERTSGNHSRIYLLGQLSDEGFNGYYFIAYLFKVPIAVQVLVFASLFIYWIRRRNFHFLENELFLLAPVLFFTIYFNFFYRAQIGIRYFLVVFPFLLIFTGSLLQVNQQISRGWRLVLVSLGVYLVVSVISYYPYYIPYFNELVLDRKISYKILADSNLDWGQAGKEFEETMLQHPEYHVNPAEPTSGTILVSANNLVGITAKPETYAWLRENYLPVDSVAYAALIFKVPDSDPVPTP